MPATKPAAAKKASGKPKAARQPKIALMKRAKGATSAEIMKATGWQPHTVRGFVSILGSKGVEKIESFKSARSWSQKHVGEKAMAEYSHALDRGFIEALGRNAHGVFDAHGIGE